MLNRETGVKPVLSRSCNAEQALKCHWVKTGKARQAMKQSQKNCLRYPVPASDMDKEQQFICYAFSATGKALFIFRRISNGFYQGNNHVFS